ncbi:MAG: hypothetical protein AB7L92_09340 [Alphaproteobacteria bacterium]
MRIVFFLMLTLASPALAYVGPGPGLTMISSFFTLVAGIIVALFFVVFYPVRQYLKRKKQKGAASTNDNTTPGA